MHKTLFYSHINLQTHLPGTKMATLTEWPFIDLMR